MYAYYEETELPMTDLLSDGSNTLRLYRCGLLQRSFVSSEKN